MGIPGRMKNIASYQKAMSDNLLFPVYRRFTAAEITTAGAELIPTPAPGVRYRMIDVSMIAIGGTVGGATDIRLIGTQNGAPVALTTTLVAKLTQGSMIRLGGPVPDVAMQNNGVSVQPGDSGTGIKIARTGGAITGATHIDVIALFILEG